MKKMRRLVAAGLVVMMCLGLSACGKEFDAAGYTKAILDANYHAEYADYAKFRNISEDEAKAEVMEAKDKQITGAFVGMDISDEDKAKYIEEVDKVYALAKYEVGEAVKDDNDNFTVTVTVEPASVFQISSACVQDIINEHANNGEDPTQMNVFVACLIESMEKGIADNSYSEATTLEVQVTKSDDNKYGIDDSGMEALESALFLE